MSGSIVLAFLVFFIAAHAANSYRVEPASTIQISEHGECRKVTNNGTKPIFVPTRTLAEYTAFLNNAPAFVLREPCTCPVAGFVPVPGNATYGVGDFCIMQFEAKNVGGVPTSQAAGSPWHSISYYEARRKCQSLGTGHDLPTNNHWQTMARNLESQAANWAGGSVGSQCMFIGNTEYDSVCEYIGPAGPTFASGTTGAGRIRARLQLSNGQFLWDVSANVAEFIQGPLDANAPATGSLTINIPAGKKTAYGATGTYTAGGCGTATCGLGWAEYGAPSYSVPRRGGRRSDNSYAGVFWLMATDTANITGTTPDGNTGFRCIYDASLPSSSCNGVLVGGACWYLSGPGETCTSVCTNNSGYHSATGSYAGNGGTNAQCRDVLDALQAPSPGGSPSTESTDLGCSLNASNARRRGTSTTTAGASATNVVRACACNG